MCPRTWAEGTATAIERDDVVRGFDVTALLVSLLGPTEVDVGAGPIPIAGSKLQALLTLLALAAPRPVSDDRLIDELWGDDQPSKPANALQAQVSQLRRLLGRDAVVRTGSGYVLSVDADGVDATRLEQLVQEGRSAVPPRRPSHGGGALRVSGRPDPRTTPRRCARPSVRATRPGPASTSSWSRRTRVSSTPSWRRVTTLKCSAP